jgi:hypothetical protein
LAFLVPKYPPPILALLTPKSQGLVVANGLAQIYEHGRAECGRTKIRGVDSPVRSGAETANISIDGWPKASGSPTGV